MINGPCQGSGWSDKTHTQLVDPTEICHISSIRTYFQFSGCAEIGQAHFWVRFTITWGPLWARGCDLLIALCMGIKTPKVGPAESVHGIYGARPNMGTWNFCTVSAQLLLAPILGVVHRSHGIHFRGVGGHLYSHL